MENFYITWETRSSVRTLQHSFVHRTYQSKMFEWQTTKILHKNFHFGRLMETERERERGKEQKRFIIFLGIFSQQIRFSFCFCWTNKNDHGNMIALVNSFAILDWTSSSNQYSPEDCTEGTWYFWIYKPVNYFISPFGRFFHLRCLF